jgi:hypothetical protein
MSLNLRERGRRYLSWGCYAYFDLRVFYPSWTGNLEISALDADATLIGSANLLNRYYVPGTIFEVCFQNVPASLVRQWRVQSIEDGVFLVAAGSVPGDISSEQMDQAHLETFSIRGEYDGQVIGNKGNHIFHHPECRSSEAIRNDRRVVFYSTLNAVKADYFPCMNCLLDLR